ncbi:CapA family protein [Lactiplantibacillus herbarum]|uniref:CapA family protein n=1 Tax=Lactiplantibacillus herbarum TaxID=1670446 RepID=UPI00069D7C46|nr:CapA family protein [Lactiplantibacillus herbarum]
MEAKKYRLDNGKLVKKIGTDNEQQHYGLGNVGTLLVLLKLIGTRKILFSDTTLLDEKFVNQYDKKEKYFKRNETVDTQMLLNLMLVTSDPVVALAICKLIREKRRKKVADFYHDFEYYNQLESSLINQTGHVRVGVPQNYDVGKLHYFGEMFLNLSVPVRDLLHTSDIVKNNVYYTNQTMLLRQNKLLGGYFFGPNHGDAFAFDNDYLYIIVGANSGFDRDMSLTALIDNKELMPNLKKASNYSIESLKVRGNDAGLTIMGDVYLGEFYSERREQKKLWDPLVDADYDYSFEKLVDYFKTRNVNIFNMESALVDDLQDSRLWQLKTFVLGSKPKETIRALKNANLNLALLANNHGADYGEKGVLSSLHYLSNNGVSHIGAGRDIDQATNPIRIKIGKQTITLFNAYWYRSVNYRDYEFYAGISKAGVSPLTMMLKEKISRERQKYPQNKIIVSPHWGGDFQNVSSYQRMLASQLIDAGADLIVGHGSHALQSFEIIKGKLVFYGLGNAVFNFNGTFEQHPDAIPFGGVIEIEIVKEKVILNLRLLNTVNKETKYQSRFVDQKEFGVVLDRLKSQGSPLDSCKIIENKQLLQFELN